MKDTEEITKQKIEKTLQFIDSHIEEYVGNKKTTPEEYEFLIKLQYSFIKRLVDEYNKLTPSQEDLEEYMKPSGRYEKGINRLAELAIKEFSDINNNK